MKAVKDAGRSDPTALVLLGGYFLLSCALTLAGAAAWHAYRQQVESSRWPPVAAQVSGCHVHTSYDSWHGRRRSLHDVECAFGYEVGGVSHLVKSKVGDTLSVVRGQIDIPPPTVTLTVLRQWVTQHPNGIVETIHYDPAYPERISLVGIDDDLKWHTTAGYAEGAVVFAVGGAGLLLFGSFLRRARSRRT